MSSERGADQIVLFAFGLGMALALATCGHDVIKSGKPDYCYIDVIEPYGDRMGKIHCEGQDAAYRLILHRPWREDVVAGRFPTYEAAKMAAATCLIPEVK